MGGKPRPPSLSTTGNPHWCTPGWLLDVARKFAVGRVALDPFGNPDAIVDAAVEWYGPRARDPAHRIDGLTSRWVIDPTPLAGRVATAWVNPPYTRHLIDQCVAKCREEGRWGPLEVCALLPGRESSAWFKEHCFPPAATGVCFINRRVKFLGNKSAVPWESVVVHWGRLNLRFYDVFSEIGTVWIR
jgi:hypothetical protein